MHHFFIEHKEYKTGCNEYSIGFIDARHIACIQLQETIQLKITFTVQHCSVDNDEQDKQ
ncbi:hypothetical protein D3C86_1392560 [compost metagenome]